MNTALHLAGRHQHTHLLHPAVESVLAFDMQQILTRLIGGLLPPELHLPKTARVLDVACGTGSWVLELAFAYPESWAEGIDIDPEMIRYARTCARVQRLDNAYFSVGDMFHLANIPNDTFDLVHVRFLAGVVEPHEWAALLQELLRVCSPGGVVCWSELGQLLTNSPACNYGYKLLQHALSSVGGTTNVTLLMNVLLDDLECLNVQQGTVTLDLSAGQAAYPSFYSYCKVIFPSVRSFLEHVGVGNAAEWAQLERQVWLEMLADTFYATWPIVTVWGEKGGQQAFVGIPATGGKSPDFLASRAARPGDDDALAPTRYGGIAFG